MLVAEGAFAFARRLHPESELAIDHGRLLPEGEVQKNVDKHAAGTVDWPRLIRPHLTAVGSVYVFDRPIVFDATKDRPVFLSAIGGNAVYLITLDTTDFAHVLGSVVCGVKVRTPKTFLQETGIVR